MRLGDTPVPIPNTTVKTQSADGTALETVWESRWAPDQKKKNRRDPDENRCWFYQWFKKKRYFLFKWLIKHQSALYLENFIQKILMKMIFYQDIREYRKQSLRPNQTNESSRSKQFDPRFKRKDPVSNAIETVNEVKQKRAQGGCLGTKSRWKTW